MEKAIHQQKRTHFKLCGEEKSGNENEFQAQ